MVPKQLCNILKNCDVDCFLGTHSPTSAIMVVINSVPCDLVVKNLIRMGVRFVRWAPNGIALWSSETQRYTWLWFPFEVLPELILDNNPSSSERHISNALKLDEYNYALPSSFTRNIFLQSKQVGVNIGWPQTKTKDRPASKLVEYWINQCPSLFMLTSLEDFTSKLSKEQLEKVKPELFGDSLCDRMLHAPQLYLGYLQRIGMLEYLLPELTANIGCQQDPRYHTEDVFDHLMRSFNEACKISSDPATRLAALFHDIGKASTRAEVSNERDEPQNPIQPVLAEGQMLIVDA